MVYTNYFGRVGEMINGIVKRIDRGAIIVELGDTEGIIPRNHQVRHERYSQGDRIRSVVVDVTMDASRPQVVLSRTAPQLLEKLLEMEVPEIYDGTVVIKKCVREPGERAKVAVFSRDRDVDPVGACVGLKGSRVQAITRELKGEKIDIIPWNSDLVTFAQNALAPAKINRVAVRDETVEWSCTTTTGQPVLDEAGEPVVELRKETVLDVIVGSEQLSLAIGKRGQNVRLASRLLNCRIEIKSEEAVKDELASALATDAPRDGRGRDGGGAGGGRHPRRAELRLRPADPARGAARCSPNDCASGSRATAPHRPGPPRTDAPRSYRASPASAR